MKKKRQGGKKVPDKWTSETGKWVSNGEWQKINWKRPLEQHSEGP